MWDSGSAGIERGRSASIVTELVTMPESVPREIEGKVEEASEEENTQRIVKSNGNKDFIKPVSDDGTRLDKLEGVTDIFLDEYWEELEGEVEEESKVDRRSTYKVRKDLARERCALASLKKD